MDDVNNLPIRGALRVLGVAVAVIVLLLLVWNVLGLLALFFASVLLAVLLRSLSRALSRRTRLPIGWALTLVVVLMFVLLILGVWLLYAPLEGQFRELEHILPQSLDLLRAELAHYEWGEPLYEQLLSFDELLVDSVLLIDRVAVVFSSTVGVLVSFLIVVFMGIYLAADPETYINGLLRLAPINRRPRLRQVLEACKDTLQWWLLGRGLAMLVVGALVTVSLWILGVPLAPALGILAALLDFIPNVGPILATIPAVLIGLVQGPAKAAAVLVVFFVIQQLESYLITPLIQQQMVKIPPALTIVAQVILVLLLGALGLLIASPLVAVLVVVVRMLYVEDVLGDRIESGETSD
jgi:predicted PurR-regulated permease PerM